MFLAMADYRYHNGLLHQWFRKVTDGVLMNLHEAYGLSEVSPRVKD